MSSRFLDIPKMPDPVRIAINYVFSTIKRQILKLHGDPPNQRSKNPLRLVSSQTRSGLDALRHVSMFWRFGWT
jgi:hypothetical protein